MAYRLLPLMVIIVLAWVLVFVGSYFIFKVIVPMPSIFPTREGLILTAIIKGASVTILVIIWMLILMKLTNLYVRKKILT